MKRFNQYISGLLILSLLACGGKKDQTEQTQEGGESEDVATLTYRQFYELMFEDYKNRLEWHEDDYNQEGKAAIEIYQQGDCETEDCGKKIYVKNNSDTENMRVVIKTSFSIPNSTPYIANQFIIKPGDEVYLTCTQFCYGGETFDLAQELVVAQFAKEE